MSKMFLEEYRSLATQILLMTIQDYKKNQDETIEDFIYSEWFDVWAEISGVDPDHSRKTILMGKTQSATLRRGKVCLL